MKFKKNSIHDTMHSTVFWIQFFLKDNFIEYEMKYMKNKGF